MRGTRRQPLRRMIRMRRSLIRSREILPVGRGEEAIEEEEEVPIEDIGEEGIIEEEVAGEIMGASRSSGRMSRRPLLRSKGYSKLN